MKKRCIYSYEFKDNCVYVGLTLSAKERKWSHKSKGSVFKHMIICSAYTFIQLTDYLNENEAQIQENFYVKKYKKENWKILNEAKTGSLGWSKTIWTKEKCKEESLKYSTKKELSKNSRGCYKRILLEKWYELFEHMNNGYIKWTMDKCIEDIKNYSSYHDYVNNSKSYQSCVRFGYLDIICEIFGIDKQKSWKYWTKEKCYEEALKYETKRDFEKYSKSAYSTSVRKNWLGEITTHMKILIIKWTKEKCEEDALKYKNRNEYYENDGNSYNAAFRHGWLNDITKHMKCRKIKNYWNYNKCKEEASKYKTRSDFYKNSISAYIKSNKNNWLNIFYPKAK